MLALALLTSAGCSCRKGEPPPVEVAPAVPASAVVIELHQERDASPVVGGGFVSPSEAVIYLPSQAGGVEAVELETGRVVWEVKDMLHLAGATDTRVVCFRTVTDRDRPGHIPCNQLQVVILAAADGNAILTSDPVIFPNWVRVIPHNGCDWFRVMARFEPEGLIFTWAFQTSYCEGPMPPPQEEAAANKDAAGRVRVDPATGRAAMISEPGGTAAIPELGRLPENPILKGTARQAKAVGSWSFQAMPGDFTPDWKIPVTLTVLKAGRPAFTRRIADQPFFPPRS